MKVVKIGLEIENNTDFEQTYDVLSQLLGAWRMNGQINGREYPIAHRKIKLEVFVNAPDSNAFLKRHNSKYVNENLSKLTKMGVVLRISVLGEEPESMPLCGCKIVSNFILFTTYLSLESSLKCAICFGGIPLYKIPKPSHGEYYKIISWQSDYQSCDSLQMNCVVGERFAVNQLSNYDSQLTKQGLAVCQSIEEVTNKKVYYYLYKGSTKSYKSELLRKCPSCQGDWLLNEPWHSIFDFKCDRCNLLSNIAWDVR